MDMQMLVDGWNAQEQKKRAATQMTLGELIGVLDAMPSEAKVANLQEAHSYRGYYSDLAFELNEGTRPAGDLLAECRAAMGKVFTGYKGGDYVMGALTPLWVASYGCCGQKLVAVSAADGKLELADDEW